MRELEEERKASSTEIGDEEPQMPEIENLDITPKEQILQDNFSPTQVDDLIAAVAGQDQIKEKDNEEEQKKEGKKKPKLTWM